MTVLSYMKVTGLPKCQCAMSVVVEETSRHAPSHQRLLVFYEVPVGNAFEGVAPTAWAVLGRLLQVVQAVKPF